MSQTELIYLRHIVGYLGEKAQSGWWPSEFFAPTSDAFLNPVFAKTKNLARYNGVVEAGRNVHDDRIGVGQRIFHLFRLPVALEQRLQELVASHAQDDAISALTSSRESAMAKLQELADGSSQTGEGPIAVGDSADFAENDWLATAAQCYLTAFESNKQCFPYVKANT